MCGISSSSGVGTRLQSPIIFKKCSSCTEDFRHAGLGDFLLEEELEITIRDEDNIRYGNSALEAGRVGVYDQFS
jgi:hypothetical protein